VRYIEEHSFRAPDIGFDAEKSQAFDALLDRTVAKGSSRAVDYDLSYPKHEFLCYLAQERRFLIHGSKNPRIKAFEPRFQTDAAGRPAERVYAIHDGILPMYFAIVNRRRYRGSLRNWFSERTEDGRVHRYYFFSINREMLERGAWTNGTVYVLPSDTFEPTLDEDGVPTEEWSSPVEVVPIAKLAVVPDDFPFLDRVETHDDTLAVRIGELQLELIRSVRRVEDIPDGACVGFHQRRGVRDAVEELAEILDGSGFLSGVSVRAGAEQDDACLYLTGEQAREAGRQLRRLMRPIRVLRKIPGGLRLGEFLLRRR
jgi:hypothetical protein